LAQLFQLGIAANHARLDALDAARSHPERTRPGAQHNVGGDGLVDTFHRQGRLWRDVEDPRHMPVGVLTDPQRSGRRRLLHARGDVDRLSSDAALGVDATAKQHAAGMNTNAHVEAGVAVLAQHPLPLLVTCVDQREPGTYGTLRIVLAGFVRTENGQHAVTGELKHLAVVLADNGRKLRERSIQYRAGLLRVEMLAQAGRADDVEGKVW
jgi:hypothetical protein